MFKKKKHIVVFFNILLIIAGSMDIYFYWKEFLYILQFHEEKKGES